MFASLARTSSACVRWSGFTAAGVVVSTFSGLPWLNNDKRQLSRTQRGIWHHRCSNDVACRLTACGVDRKHDVAHSSSTRRGLFQLQVRDLINFRGTLFYPWPQVFRPLGQGGHVGFGAAQSRGLGGKHKPTTLVANALLAGVL